MDTCKISEQVCIYNGYVLNLVFVANNLLAIILHCPLQYAPVLLSDKYHKTAYPRIRNYGL
jgi:hypothetical protein